MTFKNEVKRFLKDKEDWKTASTVLKDAGRKVVRMTSGRKNKNNKTSWWRREGQKVCDKKTSEKEFG